MHFWKQIACLAIGWMFIAHAFAGEAKQYSITFDVTSVSRSPQIDCGRFESFTFPGLRTTFYPHWGCINEGDTYTGSFSIDSDALQTDGIGVLPSTKDLRINFGRLILGGSPPNTDYFHFPVGVRSPCLPSMMSYCLRYEAKDQEIVDLIGGIYVIGGSTVTIDFDGQGGFFGGSYGQTFYGDVAITPVPEPAAFLLALLGLPAICAAARRRA
ncbi:PEP-CTERM sorting domain-containing protein [Aquincola tertiaricarbonis]|uniref:PEP-CTERM sorting domain-containing protein n=1 Tax=Aquincola tertiaricarbonis TaxID=391953 RepID=UPI000614F3D1|nr:PEP-CTERM sorting domain-containing protein [Aquincola tertiaricarbonis]